MFNLTKNEYDHYLRAADTLVKLGWVYVDGQWVAPKADPVGAVPVAKEAVTDEKGFALSLDKAFIRIATDKTLDTINKHLAVADWSALGGISAAKADDTLRADIEALKKRVEVYDDQRHEQWLVQKELNKHQNQRINELEDALSSAFSDEHKGKNKQTKFLEATFNRAIDKVLQNALKHGGILHRY